MTTHAEDPPLENHHATYRPRVICRWILGLMILATVVLVTLAWVRFGTDRPTVYEDSVEHFKYGSTGGEREAGFPYWIWKALPKVCADYLPGEGYASLGMLYEPGKDLPIGVSKRRVTGIDRVFLNCAACHTNTYRSTPDGEPQVVAGMPANSFDLMGFTRFFFDCAADGRFTPKHIMPTIQALNADLDLIDRYLVYPLAVLLMRDQLMMLRQRFAFIAGQPAWGPGRVDTFNTNKVQFNFPMDRLAPEEAPGTTDFPSIWNQRQRQGMQLHWDGNNSRVEERNRNASFGTGATPPTLDRSSIKRMENWLLDAQPPLGRLERLTRHFRRGARICISGIAWTATAPAAPTSLGSTWGPYSLSRKSAPTDTGWTPLPGRWRSTWQRSTRVTAMNASVTFARPTVTPTCPWTASGSGLPIFTMVQCRPSGICSNPVIADLGYSTGVTISTTRKMSVSFPTSRQRARNVIFFSTAVCPVIPTAATKARPTAPISPATTNVPWWNT